MGKHQSEANYGMYLRALNQLTSAANDFVHTERYGGRVGKALFLVADIMWRAAHALITDPRMLSGGSVDYNATLAALSKVTDSEVANSFFSKTTMADIDALIAAMAQVRERYKKIQDSTGDDAASRKEFMQYESARFDLAHGLSTILSKYGRLSLQINVRARHLTPAQMQQVYDAAMELTKAVGVDPSKKEAPIINFPPPPPPTGPASSQTILSLSPHVKPEPPRAEPPKMLPASVTKPPELMFPEPPAAPKPSTVVKINDPSGCDLTNINDIDEQKILTLATVVGQNEWGFSVEPQKSGLYIETGEVYLWPNFDQRKDPKNLVMVIDPNFLQDFFKWIKSTPKKFADDYLACSARTHENLWSAMFYYIRSTIENDEAAQRELKKKRIPLEKEVLSRLVKVAKVQPAFKDKDGRVDYRLIKTYFVAREFELDEEKRKTALGDSFKFTAQSGSSLELTLTQIVDSPNFRETYARIVGELPFQRRGKKGQGDLEGVEAPEEHEDEHTRVHEAACLTICAFAGMESCGTASYPKVGSLGRFGA